MSKTIGKTVEELLKEALVPVEEQPYSIPENWVWVYLDGVVDFIGGGTPSKSISSYWDGNIPWASVKDVKGRYLETTQDFISDNGLNNSSANIADINELLLITRMSPGKSTITKVKTAINQDLKIVRPKVEIMPFFLWMYFNVNIALIEHMSTGSTVKGIQITKLNEMKFPLPPIDEQKRIADKVERLLNKINQAKQLIEEAKETFELRRAAILDKAFRGELTAKWREENPNVESAYTHIVGSYDKLMRGETYTRSNTSAKKKKPEIAKYFNLLNLNRDNLPNGWIRATFIYLCVLQRGFDLPTQDRIEGNYPVVSSGGVIGYHNEFKIHGPGVTTGRSGSIGKVFYVEGDYWALNTSLFVDYFNGNDEEFVYYYLSNFNFKPFSSSTAVPTLNRNKLFDVEVCIPPLEEQKEIVKKIKSNLAKEERAIKNLDDCYKQILIIEQSIISKAIRGELGTNDKTEDNAMSLLEKYFNKNIN